MDGLIVHIWHLILWESKYSKNATERGKKICIVFLPSVVFWPLTRPKMPFQGDEPEGSDTF